MKGLSISTNVLVALAIALIVLLALVSMLMGIVPGTSEALGCEADFRVQCNRFIAAGGCKETSGMSILDGCIGVTDNCPGAEGYDEDCRFVKCSTADCALGTLIGSEIEAACCGTETTTTTVGP